MTLQVVPLARTLERSTGRTSPWTNVLLRRHRSGLSESAPRMERLGRLGVERANKGRIC